MPKLEVYIYGEPLTPKKLAAALGIPEAQVETCQTEADRVVVKFMAVLTLEQEAKLNKLMQPFVQIRKGQEGP